MDEYTERVWEEIVNKDKKRIEELEAELRIAKSFHDVAVKERNYERAENKRLLDIQGLLISWMKRHKTDTSYPHKPTQQTYWEQIISDYPFLTEHGRKQWTHGVPTATNPAPSSK